MTSSAFESVHFGSPWLEFYGEHPLSVDPSMAHSLWHALDIPHDNHHEEDTHHRNLLDRSHLDRSRLVREVGLHVHHHGRLVSSLAGWSALVRPCKFSGDFLNFKGSPIPLDFAP